MLNRETKSQSANTNIKLIKKFQTELWEGPRWTRYQGCSEDLIKTGVIASPAGMLPREAKQVSVA